jgi:biopolymer transport protein ExbB/TolQ
MFGMIEFIKGNLLHVLPILVAGAFAAVIILERLRALYLVYPVVNEDRFFESVQDCVMKGKVAEALAIADRHAEKPVARVVKTALMRAHQPENLIRDGLALVVEQSTQKIQKRTSFLAMIANVATLLGLLGTIAGLIQSFAAMSSVDAQQKTVLLAKGISEAMNATMLGLGVAIPCMVAFSFLANRSNHLVSSVETAAVRVLDILKQRYFETESKAVPSKYKSGVA